MPLSVLEPVRRPRRRSRASARRVSSLLVLLVAGAGLAAWQLWPDAAAPGRLRSFAGQVQAAAPRRSPRPRPFAGRPLVFGPPLLRHRFRPPLSAASAILVDARNGRVLWALRPHQSRPVASTTKIMTALLVVQHLRPRALVTIAPSVPRVVPVRDGLRAGQRLPVWKLLYGMLLYSGNDDALALALAVSGDRPVFLKLMNEQARRLRLRDTRFSTPSGVIDPGNYSSAWDLAALSRYALRSPLLRRIVATKQIRVPWPAPTYAKLYLNRNRLLGSYPGADGVKTGWTSKAGECLVASAHRHGLRLLAVVLAASRPYDDATRLLNLGFRSLS